MHTWITSLLTLVGLATLLTLPVGAASAPPAMPFTPEKFSPEGFPVVNGVEMHLIETASDNGHVSRKWLSEKEVFGLKVADKGFIDVTFHANDNAQSASFAERQSSVPTKVEQKELTERILRTTNTSLLKTILPKLTEFHNRYYRAPTGAQSSNYLFEQVKNIASRAKYGVNVTVKQFEHSWVQKSIIARIEGKPGQNETIVIGAHQDSINRTQPLEGRAPGADDDGSGSVSSLEAFRALIDYGFKPVRPLEFQWYAGEEAGLLGSQDIAVSYQKEGRKIPGMLQLDMTGTPAHDRPTDIGLVSDFVNDGLSNLTEAIIKTYVPELPIVRFKCNYGCSDHASWNRSGYPSAFPFESGKLRDNLNIHTTNDTVDKIDFDHALRFSKVAISFAVEMSYAR